MARYARVLQLEQFKRMLYKKLSRKLYPEDVEELGNFRSIEFNWQRFFSLCINEEPFYTIRQKDLKKVKFDWSQILFYQDEVFLGFHQIEDLCFAGICAGGDWEWRVHFILYINDKNQVRGYIPENGNLFNRKTKSAFGNSVDSDNDIAQKEYRLESYADLGREQESPELMREDVIKWINVKEVFNPNINNSVSDNK